MIRFLALAIFAVTLAASARADILVVIDKASQRMAVTVDGVTLHVWKVSTGRFGRGTPNGLYAPERLSRHWYSRKYDWAPMPYSIFFHEGYAIHGSTFVSRLGTPASHGCVRLHPKDAAVLFSLVQSEGKGATMIAIVGENPGPARAPVVAARSHGVSARARTTHRPPPNLASPAVDYGVRLWENRS